MCDIIPHPETTPRVVLRHEAPIRRISMYKSSSLLPNSFLHYLYLSTFVIYFVSCYPFLVASQNIFVTKLAHHDLSNAAGMKDENVQNFGNVTNFESGNPSHMLNIMTIPPKDNRDELPDFRMSAYSSNTNNEEKSFGPFLVPDAIGQPRVKNPKHKRLIPVIALAPTNPPQVPAQAIFELFQKTYGKNSQDNHNRGVYETKESSVRTNRIPKNLPPPPPPPVSQPLLPTTVIERSNENIHLTCLHYDLKGQNCLIYAADMDFARMTKKRDAPRLKSSDSNRDSPSVLPRSETTAKTTSLPQQVRPEIEEMGDIRIIDHEPNSNTLHVVPNNLTESLTGGNSTVKGFSIVDAMDTPHIGIWKRLSSMSTIQFLQTYGIVPPHNKYPNHYGRSSYESYQSAMPRTLSADHRENITIPEEGYSKMPKYHSQLILSDHADCRPRVSCVEVDGEEGSPSLTVHTGGPWKTSLYRKHGVMYWPACIEIERCSGCCLHGCLKCQPTEKSLKQFLILKLQIILTEDGPQFNVTRTLNIKLEKHEKCECECNRRIEACRSSHCRDI